MTPIVQDELAAKVLCSAVQASGVAVVSAKSPAFPVEDVNVTANVSALVLAFTSVVVCAALRTPFSWPPPFFLA